LSTHQGGGDVALIVRQAWAFTAGPLKLCLEHELTGLLGTAPMSHHITTVFWTSLKPSRCRVVRHVRDLLQLRSGCLTFRHRPVFMFFFECLMAGVYLFLVASVAAEAPRCTVAPAGGDAGVCTLATAAAAAGKDGGGTPFNAREWSIVVMLWTSMLYDAGDLLDRGSLRALSLHIWDVADALRTVLVLLWLFYRARAGAGVEDGTVFLAISAVPMSLSLLRFLSIFPALGRLVVMIIGMVKELGAFFVLFLVFVLGFGIAFHSLFRDLDGFRSTGATVLTLFDAALGGHEFQPFRGHTYEDVGVAVMIVYVVFVVIILLNLIIARMTVRIQPPNQGTIEPLFDPLFALCFRMRTKG